MALPTQNVSRRVFGQSALTGALLAAANQLTPHAFGRTTSDRIRVGQIGTGHAHASKLSVYLESDDYEVVGIAEPDEQRREAARQRPPYRDVPWMGVEELLGQPGLQVVLVETEVGKLLDVAERCIDSGLHVHLDKPAGESLPTFQRILRRAEERQLLLQMGYMYRYNPAAVLLRQFVRNGWLGDVFELHAVMSKTIGAGERRQLARFAGGTMFELGCHLIDWTVDLLGEPTAVTPYVRHSSSIDDELNDNMLAVLEYQRATATIRSSAQEVDGGQRRHLTVCGSGGTFHIQPLDSPTARITLAEPRGEFEAGTRTVEFPRYVRYVDDAAEMARILRGEQEARFSYAHDLAVQRTILQASGLTLDE